MFAYASSALFRLTSAACLFVAGAASVSAAPTTLYPQAAPTAQEQYLLELINRARANPAQEGVMLATVTDSEILRYYSHYAVDTNKLRSDFAGYQAQPPLALNPLLMQSCRAQALDQAAHGFQGHDGTDGSSFSGRISAAGYAWQAAGENTFTYVENPFFGHVGLNADWGVPALDHRENIMNTNASVPVFKEVGIACMPTSIANFGPLVITEDFAAPRDSSVAYVTGVIYNDANGNGFYDENEGLGGVTVTPDQGDAYTVTGAAGNFTLPLPAGVASGVLTITASGGGLGAPRVKTVAFVAGTNVKVDFTSADAAGAPVAAVSVKTVSRVATIDGSRVGVVTVARQGGLGGELTVNLKFGGSAKSSVDYSPLPQNVTIPAGQDNVVIQVQALDRTFTGVKKLKVRVAPGQNYDHQAGAAAVKILQ